MSHELATGASSSRTIDVERRTSEGVVIGVDNTDGFPTSQGAVSDKLDPSNC